MKKNKIVLILSFFVCLFICSPAYAFDITITDSDGNENILVSVDSSGLGSASATPSLMSIDDGNIPAPHPSEAAYKIPGLSKIMSENGGFYETVSCMVFDFGPDWETVFEQDGSNETITGRYIYLFIGAYDPDEDIILDGNGNSGRDKYTYYTVMDTLEVNEPYALVSYNAESDSLDVVTNTYDNSVTGASTLTLSDVYLWGDPSGAYPYCFAFQDDLAGSLEWNGASLFTGISAFAWDYYEGSEEENTPGASVDMTQTNNLLESIIYQIGNIFPWLNDILEAIKAIGVQITELPSLIYSQFVEMLNTIQVAIDEGFVGVIEAIQNQEIKVEVDEDGKSLWDYLMDFLQPAASFFGALAGSALDGIVEAAEFAANVGSDVFDFLATALLQILPIIALIASLGGWLVGLFGFLPTEFATFITAMVSILVVGILIKIALNVK